MKKIPFLLVTFFVSLQAYDYDWINKTGNNFLDQIDNWFPYDVPIKGECHFDKQGIVYPLGPYTPKLNGITGKIYENSFIFADNKLYEFSLTNGAQINFAGEGIIHPAKLHIPFAAIFNLTNSSMDFNYNFYSNTKSGQVQYNLYGNSQLNYYAKPAFQCNADGTEINLHSTSTLLVEGGLHPANITAPDLASRVSLLSDIDNPAILSLECHGNNGNFFALIKDTLIGSPGSIVIPFHPDPNNILTNDNKVRMMQDNTYTGRTYIAGGELILPSCSAIEKSYAVDFINPPGILTFEAPFDTLSTRSHTLNIYGKYGLLKAANSCTITIPEQINAFGSLRIAGVGGTIILTNHENNFYVPTDNGGILQGEVMCLQGNAHKSGIITYGQTSLCPYDGSWTIFDQDIYDDVFSEKIVATTKGYYGKGGYVVKEGSKKVTFTNQNTYGLETFINHGTLALAGSGSIESSYCIDIAPGALFDIENITYDPYYINGIQNQGTVNIKDKTLHFITPYKICTHSNQYFFSVGPINGTTGGLIKEGPGILFLADVPYTYQGDTQVLEGTLVLQNATLNSTNTILNGWRSQILAYNTSLMGYGDVQNLKIFEGILNPSYEQAGIHKTITVNGKYIQNDDNGMNGHNPLQIQIDTNGTDNTLIHVTDTASISGGELIVDVAKLVPSYMYRFITTANGLTVSNPMTAARCYIDHDAFDYYFWTEVIKPFSIIIKKNTNKSQVANQVSGMRIFPPYSIQFFTPLNNLPLIDPPGQETLDEALEELSAAQYTNLFYITQEASQRFLRKIYYSLIQRVCTGLIECKEQNKSPFVKDSKRSKNPGCYNLDYTNSQKSLKKVYEPSVRNCYPECGNGANIWLIFEGGKTKQRGDKRAKGYSESDWDIALGAHKCINDYSSIGAAITYEQDRLHFDQGGTGTQRNYMGAIFGTYHNDYLYLLSELLGGYSHDKIIRRIEVQPNLFRAKSKPNIGEIVFNNELGFSINYSSFGLKPFVTLEYTFLHRSSIEEHGAYPFDINVKKRNVNALGAFLGTHLAGLIANQLILGCDISYEYRFNHHRDNMVAHFREFGGNMYIKGYKKNPHIGHCAIDFSEQFTDLFNWDVRANFDVSKGYYSWDLSTGFSFKW